MALVVRYFSTTSAGAADGTSWANRAALLSTGAFSTIITGFAFNGTDSLLVVIGPGTYTVTTGLTTGSFSNAPTAANPLIFHGCDSSGVLLTPPDPNWSSDQPAWDVSGMPVIATTSNIATLTGSTTAWHARFINFTGSGRNGALVTNLATLDWCSLENSTANSSAGCSSGTVRLSNCLLACSGSSYQYIVTGVINAIDNCRFTGAAGSSGNRDAVSASNTTAGMQFTRNTITGCGGRGWYNNAANAGVMSYLINNTILNCGSTGIELPSTASQTNFLTIFHNYIANCAAYGINAQSAANVMCFQNRLRDNASGNLNGLGNFPTSENYTTDSDDATELYNAATGDYRIKSTAAIWGSGYGVSEAPAPNALNPFTSIFGGSRT
ncbi:MAG: right-handed parallel beta-helix repeat-containing protein [Planctomycetaceae bacterium]